MNRSARRQTTPADPTRPGYAPTWRFGALTPAYDWATRDHAHGRLSERLRAGGLVYIVQHATLTTPAGTVGLLSGRPGRRERIASPAGVA